LYTNLLIKERHRIVGRLQEKVHAYNKEQGGNDARDHDPFPQPVLAYEVVCINIGLYGNDDLFEQARNLLGKYIQFNTVKAI
jgi:hypothetical protein